MSDFVWGTITSTSPLEVVFDGDTTSVPLPSKPHLLDTGTLVIGDVVRFERSGRRRIAVERLGGGTIGGFLVGVVYSWPGPDPAPEGLLPLDGSSVAVADYPLLAEAHPSWVDGATIELPDLGGDLHVCATPAGAAGPQGVPGPAGPAGPQGEPGPAGPPASPAVRQSVSWSTASLGAGASEDGSLELAVGYRLLQIATSGPARVRVYASSAHRAADAGRPVGTDPVGDHGLLLEYVTTPTVLTAVLSPFVDGASLDDPPSADIPVAVTNLDAAPAVVEVTLTYIGTE